MLQLQLQSEDGYLLILTLQGYEEYSSTPFTFALNVQLAGFSSRQVLQQSRAYAGSFNQWSLDFDYSTLHQFRDDLQHLNQLVKEQAVLSNADETFQLAIGAYGKRGYLLAKVTMQYNIVPKMQD